MKYSIFIICLSLSTFCIGQPQPEVINWEHSNTLTWNDFRGEVDKDILAAAMTSYKINLVPEAVMVDENDMIQGYENLTVVTQFYKELSWHTNDSNTLLAHEQLHFDIAELYARKIRQRFSELKIAKEARFTAYLDAYNILWKACRTYQKQYDRETAHGRNLLVNLNWEERVGKQLGEMNDFAFELPKE